MKNAGTLGYKESESQTVAAGTKRLIIRHCGNAHPHMCRYLVEHHGFSDLCRFPRDSGSKSKLAHIKDLVGDLLFAVHNLRRIRQAREIITTGPMALVIALGLKLGLLPGCGCVCWLGLFIHNPRWLRLSRWITRALNSPRIRYVLFSEYEKPLYVQSLRLEGRQLLYIPYGNMSEVEIKPDARVVRDLAASGKPFFFSGGYSNRDYLPLIEIFRKLPHRLVIICASMNTEIVESEMPPNVTVLRDQPSETFEAYAQGALACIIPIAHDTGAAGQSCLLRYMHNRKVIIATNTGIIREYIEHDVSGILVKDNRAAMAAAIMVVAADPVGYQRYGDAAQMRYRTCFSRDAIARRLDDLVTRHMGSSHQHFA